MAAGSVLLTRPQPEADRSAARLAALGYQAVVAPLLLAEAVPAVRSLSGFDAVAMTSARAAGFLGRTNSIALAGRPAFAVGARTADAMRAAGFRDVRSAEGDVTALGALIAASGLPAKARIAHIGGEERAGDLGALVAASGMEVEAFAVYRMVPVAEFPTSAAMALGTGSLAAVLHYSPRSAWTFLELAEAAGLLGPAEKIRHMCLSEQVAAPLRRAFGPTISVARQPTEPSLLEALGS